MGYALRQTLVSTHFNHIKNIIGSLRVKFLGLVRRSCTLSLMVQFTFFTFGNIEKKTKMLSADVQKFVAKLDARLVSRFFSSLCCLFIACCFIVSSSFLVLHKCYVITHLNARVI